MPTIKFNKFSKEGSSKCLPVEPSLTMEWLSALSALTVKATV